MSRPRRIRSLLALSLAALGALGGSVALDASPVGAAPNSAAPEGWVMVDATTGQVVNGANQHTALPIGALGKLITALTVVERLAPDATATPGARALSAPPGSVAGAREATPMQTGQQWKVQDLLAAIVVGSANDAAYTLGETLGAGDAANWSQIGQSLVDRLGSKDAHTVLDPAGLDGASSVGAANGTTMSAFDLATVARNVLAVPELVELAASPSYTFTGPDSQSYTVENSNPLIAELTSQGVTGLKQGFTNAAKQVALVTAERNGRTLILVMLNCYDPSGWAEQLLEEGFATDPATLANAETVPAPAVNSFAARQGELNALLALTKDIGNADAAAAATSTTNAAGSTSSSTTATSQATSPTSSAAGGDASGDATGESDSGGGLPWGWILILALGAAYGARVVQVRSRRNRRRAQRRRREAMMRRGSLPVLDEGYRPPSRQSQQASSHVRVRRINEPDNPEEPWPDDEW